MSTDKKKTKGTPDGVDVHVGQRLKVRRKLLGLSQEKLAETIGLTFQQIQKYERGMNRISAGRLYQFSKVLEVPISFFFENLKQSASNSVQNLGLSDNGQDAFMHDDFMNSDETLDLVRVYYSIKDKDKRKDIVRFIKSMVDKG